jgi:hypothetical protein
MYICAMKNEITIPVQIHDLKENELIAEADHRKKYSQKRDALAEDFNKAIRARLDRDKERQEDVPGEEGIVLDTL